MTKTSSQRGFTSPSEKSTLLLEISRLLELLCVTFTLARRLKEFPDLTRFCWLLNTTLDHYLLRYLEKSLDKPDFTSIWMIWLTARLRWREISLAWLTPNNSNKTSLGGNRITSLITWSSKTPRSLLTQPRCTESTMLIRLPLLIAKEFLAALEVLFQTLLHRTRTLWECQSSLMISPIWK